MNDIVYLCINYYFIGTINMYALTVVSTYYVDQFLSVCLWNFIMDFIHKEETCMQEDL